MSLNYKPQDAYLGGLKQTIKALSLLVLYSIVAIPAAASAEEFFRREGAALSKPNRSKTTNFAAKRSLEYTVDGTPIRVSSDTEGEYNPLIATSAAQAGDNPPIQKAAGAMQPASTNWQSNDLIPVFGDVPTPLTLKYINFKISDPNLPVHPFNPEYNPIPSSNSTSISFGIAPRELQWRDLLYILGQITFLHDLRYYQGFTHSIDKILCGPENGLFRALTDAGISEHNPSAALKMYMGGCAIRDQYLVGDAIENITLTQRDGLIDKINKILSGKGANYKFEAYIDTDLSSGVRHVLLKIGDAAILSFEIAAAAGAFSKGGQTPQEAPASSSSPPPAPLGPCGPFGCGP